MICSHPSWSHIYIESSWLHLKICAPTFELHHFISKIASISGVAASYFKPCASPLLAPGVTGVSQVAPLYTIASYNRNHAND